MSEKKYDSIIIGGGHNGLVCASILAKKNKKVLVCEAREICGGMANHEIVNYVPSIPNSVSQSIGGLNLNYNSKGSIALSESGKHIRLIGNQHLDHATIASFSPQDADRYLEFHDKMSLFSKTLLNN